jgi:hypothetical protein
MPDALRTEIDAQPDAELIRQRILTLDTRVTGETRAHIRHEQTAEDAAVEAEVVRTTAIGVELTVSSDPMARSFVRGSRVVVELQGREVPSTFIGSVVSRSESRSGQVLLAVRIHTRSALSAASDERRKEVRWNCSSDYYPTGVASNPSKYNDFIYFRVLDVSKSGLRLLTSMRNKFIARDMMLDSIISLPMVSQITAKLKVGNVSITNDNGKDHLAVGVEFVDLTPAKFKIIVQYLAQFGDESSLRSMRDEGVLPATVADSIEFSFVRSSEDYEQVLELRRMAYSAEDKVPPETPAEEMSDLFDSRSRIVLCKLRGRVVASARLTFHEQSDLLEHEEYVAWSPDLPRRDESVEVTRACTHPEYRAARLFFPLLSFIVMTALEARRTWVITSSTTDLLEVYERVGMTRLGTTYANPMLNNATHHLLIGNMIDAVLGRSVGPVIWNMVWRRASEFAIGSLDLPVDPASRVRLFIYRLITPVVPFIRQLQSLLGSRTRRGG